MPDHAVNTIARERVEDIASKNGEPSWLREHRLSSWEAYLQVPMPNGKDEEWRKTDIEALDLSALQALDLAAKDLTKVDNLPAAFDFIQEYFPNRTAVVAELGQTYISSELPAHLAEQGVVFCTLKEALANHSDLIKPYLTSADDNSKFVLLNKALFNGGTFLHVPAGVEITEPFIAITHMSSAGVDETHEYAVFPRLIASLGENSKASLINIFNSEARSIAPQAAKTLSLTNGLIELNLGRSSQLDYLELQNFDPHMFGIVRTKNNLAQDANLNSLTVGLGGSQLKGDIVTCLQERGASSNLFGIVLGDNSEHFNFNTIQKHNAPDTQSHINFRVVLKDRSSSVYQGIIEVTKVAQRIVAFQSNKNLLLGSEARADSIPKLEILADDVKCSHGATVGPVDSEQIFYLMSRGLTSSEAEQLIVTGFFKQILESCKIGRAQDWIYELLVGKIHNNRNVQ